MPNRGNIRKPKVREATLDSKLEKRLAVYAAAAGAAGVGMLALAPPARAQIVYTPANLPVPHDGYFLPIDFNHDGAAEFSLWIRTYADFGPQYADLFLYGVKAPNQVERTGGPPAARLSSGAEIGPAQEFSRAHQLFGVALAQFERAYTQAGTTSFCEGAWKQPQKDGYLGVRFVISGQPYFGWIRLTAGCQAGESGAGVKAIVTGYAYNSESGQPILAGQETSSAGASRIPRDSGSLGQLALGALGLDFWRRRE